MEARREWDWSTNRHRSESRQELWTRERSGIPIAHRLPTLRATVNGDGLLLLTSQAWAVGVRLGSYF